MKEYIEIHDAASMLRSLFTTNVSKSRLGYPRPTDMQTARYKHTHTYGVHTHIHTHRQIHRQTHTQTQTHTHTHILV